MYAIIKTGGKQYRVSEGAILRIEKVDATDGETVTFDKVLLIGGDKVTVGTPLVKGATVTATVLEQTRDKKVIVFKKKRRQNYRRKAGHKQFKTVVKITGIAA